MKYFIAFFFFVNFDAVCGSMKVIFHSKKRGFIRPMNTRLNTRLSDSRRRLWLILTVMAKRRFLSLLMMPRFR